MSQVEETSYTYAQYRNVFRDRQQFRNIKYILANSDGTHFEYQDALGERRFGVISDLSSFSIARIGQVLVTIPVNTFTAAATDTISPALNDSTLTNWRIFASARQTTVPAAAYGVGCSLNSISQILVRAQRPLTVAQSNVTGVTIGAGGDLIDVDVLALNPHGSDVGVGPHGHTIAAHPVVDPGHTHPLGISAAQVIVTVDWMIVHK